MWGLTRLRAYPPQGSCVYRHANPGNNESPSQACMRYSASYDSNSVQSYIQCQAFGGWNAGISCWCVALKIHVYPPLPRPHAHAKLVGMSIFVQSPPPS